jgi:hypothetical protein
VDGTCSGRVEDFRIGQAILEHGRGRALAAQRLGDFITLVVDSFDFVAAAGQDNDRRAAGFTLWQVHSQGRINDLVSAPGVPALVFVFFQLVCLVIGRYDPVPNWNNLLRPGIVNSG